MAESLVAIISEQCVIERWSIELKYILFMYTMSFPRAIVFRNVVREEKRSKQKEQKPNIQSNSFGSVGLDRGYVCCVCCVCVHVVWLWYVLAYMHTNKILLYWRSYIKVDFTLNGRFCGDGGPFRVRRIGGFWTYYIDDFIVAHTRAQGAL